MRTVETSAGPVEIRALTRKEIKGGKAFGLRYVGAELTPENFDGACDYCLGLMVDEDVLDGLAVEEIRSLFRAVIAENWSAPGEEKNS